MMSFQPWHWAPAGVLLIGSALNFAGIQQQRSMPLRVPLDEAVPATLLGYRAEDIVVPEEEQRVAGMSSYVMRLYSAEAAPSAAAFSLYVGYYKQQAQGTTIHSPKNCLPGAGWEPISSSVETVTLPSRTVPVNRYMLQNGAEKALVLYWYQGRGRVAANEYAVKWHLLTDQALRGRSDEALVRILIPVTGTEADALQTALRVAQTVIPAVDSALPS